MKPLAIGCRPGEKVGNRRAELFFVDSRLEALPRSVLMSMHTTLRNLVPLLLTASASADVLDVRGPSPDFNQIQQAVAAAQDGDVIRVWPGTYSAVWIDDKDLDILRAEPGVVQVVGTLRVRNLSQGRSVTLAGIDAEGVDGAGLVVSDCAGSVRIREGSFRGGVEPEEHAHMGPAGAVLQSSDDVELVDCSVWGGWPTPSFEHGGSGGTALTISDSRVTLFASRFEGRGGGTDDDPGASGYPGGDAISAGGGGLLFVSGCELVGGHGGNADPDPGIFGDFGSGGWGGDALRAFGTSCYAQDNVYSPGDGGWGPNGQSGGPGSEYSSNTNLLPGTSRVLRAARSADDAAALDLSFEGAPGDEVWLLTSRAPGYRFHPVRGPFLVDVPAAPASQAWRYMGTIDGSGVLTTSTTAPELDTLGHVTLHLQGAFMRGKNYFGASSWTVVLDGAW